ELLRGPACGARRAGPGVRGPACGARCAGSCGGGSGGGVMRYSTRPGRGRAPVRSAARPVLRVAAHPCSVVGTRTQDREPVLVNCTGEHRVRAAGYRVAATAYQEPMMLRGTEVSTTHIVVMGISGSGKSTVAAGLVRAT